jgi:hypothetical protein
MRRSLNRLPAHSQQPVGTAGSLCRAAIMRQQSAQSGPPLNASEIEYACIRRRRPLANRPIPQPLMRPLLVVMLGVLANQVVNVLLAENTASCITVGIS